jgi:hypothetical protein
MNNVYNWFNELNYTTLIQNAMQIAIYIYFELL